MECTQAAVIVTTVLHNICKKMNLDDMGPDIGIPNYAFGFHSENAPDAHPLNQPYERQT